MSKSLAEFAELSKVSRIKQQKLVDTVYKLTGKKLHYKEAAILRDALNNVDQEMKDVL